MAAKVKYPWFNISDVNQGQIEEIIMKLIKAGAGEFSPIPFTNFTLCCDLLEKLQPKGRILVLINLELLIVVIQYYIAHGYNVKDIYFVTASAAKARSVVDNGFLPMDNVRRLNKKTLTLKEGAFPVKDFDVAVGNPPYSIPIKGEGRTAGTKKRLYALFFHQFFKNVPSYGIVLPSNWIGRVKDTVRTGILNDCDVKWVYDVSHHFDDKIKGTPTCAVVKCAGYNNSEKLTQDKSGNVSKIESKRFVSFNGVKFDSVLSKLTAPISMASLWRRNINTGVNRSSSLLSKVKTKYPVVLVTGKRNEPPVTGFIHRHVDQKNINDWKVIVNCNAATDAIGAIKIVEPGYYTTDSIVFFVAKSKKEAVNIQQFLESKIVKFIVAAVRNSHGNSKAFFGNVPLVNFSRTWTVEQLYKHFNLTNDEIKLIEDTVK